MNCPFLSVTVIGKRTRRILTSNFSWPGSVAGVGLAFGFWPKADVNDASTAIAKNKQVVLIICIELLRLARRPIRCRDDLGQLPFHPAKRLRADRFLRRARSHFPSGRRSCASRFSRRLFPSRNRY